MILPLLLLLPTSATAAVTGDDATQIVAWIDESLACGVVRARAVSELGLECPALPWAMPADLCRTQLLRNCVESCAATPETCNGVDDDCDGLIDDDDPDITGATEYHRDSDRDRYGSDTETVLACSRPVGYLTTGGDCDDAQAGVNPGAVEIDGNGVDEDCDGADGVPTGVPEVVYEDHAVYDTTGGDGDGVPEAGEEVELNVSLGNVGTATATGVSATLWADDPSITVTDGAASFGDIDVGEVAGPTDTLRFAVAAGCVTSFTAPFTLDIEDADGHGWSEAIDVPVTCAPAAPTYDLRAEGVEVGDYSVAPGDSIDLAVLVSNTGTAAITSYEVDVYFSTNTTISTSDTLACRATVAGLPAGTSSAEGVTCTVPAVADGSWYVGVIVDPAGSIAEENETDNRAWDATPVVVASPTWPDLEVASVSLGATAGAPGDTFSLTYTARNSGDASAGASTASVRFSTNSTISASDTEACRASTAALAAGASSSATISGCTVPSGLDGTYYVGILLDVDDAVAESDEGNNAAPASGTFAVSTEEVDLEVYSVSAADHSVSQGEAETYYVGVRNNGTVTTAVELDLYYSTNTTITASDNLVCRTNPGSLVAGAASVFTVSCSVPSTLTAGTYYLGAQVDTDGDLDETDEGNNDGYDASTVTISTASSGQPDLQVRDVYLSGYTGVPGDTFSVYYTRENTGAAAAGSFRLSVRFSTNTTISGSDAEACDVNISSMSAGESRSTGLTSCVVPSVADGDYYVGVYMDIDSAVAESSETNNTGYDATRFAVGGDGSVDGFDYPIDSSGYATEASDGDGYYVALDWSESWSTYYYHCGEDWNGEGGGSSDYGDPVYAVANGYVTAAGGYGSGWGDIITIEHDVVGAGDAAYEVMESQYAHLSAMYVSVGDYVVRGQQIAEIGDADGYYSGTAHLHFELRWDEGMSPGDGGYGCSTEGSGTIDPSVFIDGHRSWP